MDSNFNNKNDPWEFSLDIDDSGLRLTPVLHSYSSKSVEPSLLTPNPVRIIPGPSSIVQQAKLLKEKKVVEDEDFNSGAWVSATNYVIANGGTVTGCLGDIDNFLKNGKLEQVVGIAKSCSPNVIGDLTVTIKDLLGIIPRTIHYKVIGEGGYGKDITVGAAMILVNVSVFTPKPLKHYLNITKKNVVKVFCKDTVLASDSGKARCQAAMAICQYEIAEHDGICLCKLDVPNYEAIELHLGDGEFVSHFAVYYCKSSFSLQILYFEINKGQKKSFEEPTSSALDPYKIDMGIGRAERRLPGLILGGGGFKPRGLVGHKALKKNQPKGHPFTAHMLAICNAHEPVAFEAHNTFSYSRKKDAKGKKPRAKTGQRRKQTSSTINHNHGSKIEATKASTILHCESASGHDASAASTTNVDPGNTDPNDSASKAEKEVIRRYDEFNTSPDLSNSDDSLKDIKLEDFSKLVQNVKVDFMDLDSPEDDEPIIIQDEDEEEVHAEKGDVENDQTSQNQKLEKLKTKVEAEVAFLLAQPLYPNVEELTELPVKSLQPKLSKLLSSRDFSKSLPSELKELPAKFNDLFGEIKELKKHVHKLEIDLPGYLKEIPTKMEKFTSTVFSLTTQVAKLKTLHWELPDEFLYVLGQVSSIQAKIKTLDALLSLLHKVTEALNMFSQVFELTSKKTKDPGVPSAGQAGTCPAEGEKNTQ
ncbi:reverse transcriptase domain-containing protein [Tanacetum coccineum]